jgi:hypothetical protein
VTKTDIRFWKIELLTKKQNCVPIAACRAIGESETTK